MRGKVKVKRQKSKVKYKILPHIATADYAFQAFGKNYNELFENAACAVSEISVSLKDVKPFRTKWIKLTRPSLEELLFSFLQELVFVKDSEGLIFKDFQVEVAKRKGNYQLLARLKGERIDYKKHEVKADIKAITKHLFKIKKDVKKGYFLTCVVDV